PETTNRLPEHEVCGECNPRNEPQGWGKREKQQVTKSRTKSSHAAARGRASPLSGEPGKPVRAIRADRWRPEGQRASNGRGASEGSGRHIRRRDSIRGLPRLRCSGCAHKGGEIGRASCGKECRCGGRVVE